MLAHVLIIAGFLVATAAGAPLICFLMALTDYLAGGGSRATTIESNPPSFRPSTLRVTPELNGLVDFSSPHG